MYDLSGRVAVVTGGAANIGFSIVERLVGEGASVAFFDVDQPSIDAALAKLPNVENVRGIQADVSDPDSVRAAADVTRKELGPVDIVVNNAGIAIFKSYVEHTVDDIDRQLAVNLRGPHLLMSEFLPDMIERRRGAIVNIASAAAIRFTVAHAGYAASKAALIALTRDVAFEVAPYGVRVNGIAPGLIAVEASATKTPLLARLDREQGRDLHAPTTTRPLGQGRPEDIANVVTFLVSDEARFVIGVTIPVAGGTDLKVTMALPGEPLQL